MKEILPFIDFNKVFFTTIRPSPVPISFVVKKGIPSSLICAPVIPTPVSIIETHIDPFVRSVSIVSVPPSGIASIAFFNRLSRHCFSFLDCP